MKPALSVVLFTVLCGAGLGALALLALADIASFAFGSPVPVAGTLIGSVALVLVVAGLCASTLHLANPRNAWRSLTRWRSSWLSREALVALAFIPVALVYIGVRRAGIGVPAAILSLAVVVLSWSVLYCTAMIYASLAPIRQWHTRRVPLIFWLLAHASGALLVVSIASVDRPARGGWIVTALALFALGLVAKLEYWRFVKGGERGVTLGRAIGVGQGVGPAGRTVAAARLLDAGHSKGTFLTREFVHPLAVRARRSLRIVALAAGFAVPLLWLVAGQDWRVGVAAFVACLIGFCAERWLFFAEARHTVRLYHGEART